MTALDWIIRLLFGGLLGMLGQGLRTVSGLKKIYDEASHKGATFKETFEPSRLAMSLLIGFVAGSLAVLAMDVGQADWTPARQELLTLIGAGYAGADFIEGFVARYLPKGSSSEPDAPTGAPATRSTIADRDVPAVG